MLAILGCAEWDPTGRNEAPDCRFDSSATGSEFDVVILNGGVMDPEYGIDGVRNLVIKDGRITVITDEDIAGNEALDATGHVVAPGWNYSSAGDLNRALEFMQQAMEQVSTQESRTRISTWVGWFQAALD